MVLVHLFEAVQEFGVEKVDDQVSGAELDEFAEEGKEFQICDEVVEDAFGQRGKVTDEMGSVCPSGDDFLGLCVRVVDEKEQDLTQDMLMLS